MTIPQIEGWLKNILCVFVGATLAALITASTKGELTGWDKLSPALKKESFIGFMAGVFQVAGWLGQSSPAKPQ